MVDEKNDKGEFGNIPKTNEEDKSVTYDCIRFIDSYRFQSSSLDSLVNTLKGLEKEILDKDEILNVLNEKKIIEEDKYEKDCIKDLKEDYPDIVAELEESLLSYIGETDLKFLKTEFPDNKWECLTKKLAYPNECFNSLDVYEKHVNNL